MPPRDRLYQQRRGQQHQYQSEWLRSCTNVASESVEAATASTADGPPGVVAHEVAARIAAGECGISGLMLESFLVAGSQSLGGELVYGQSVTDKCMDFATTADVLARLHDAKRWSRERVTQS